MLNERSKRRAVFLGGAFALTLALGLAVQPAAAQETIKIGHVAALSGASAQSGEAITRGLAIAIDEINAKGGLLGGRKLELIQRDDESNPPKGVVAARELISKEKVVAMFGGIDTPVALAMCRSSTRRRCRTWRCGPPAPASPATAPTPTTCSASPPSTCWSTSSCSTTPTRSSAPRSRA